MEDESFPSHSIIPIKDADKPSLNFEVPPCKLMQNLAQEVGFVSVKSNRDDLVKSMKKLSLKKREVLSEVSNFKHPHVIRATGDRNCPQKSRPRSAIPGHLN
uniref:Uncharacterized protein n=1 Tax=Salix viminalis TaxID=40686 RepID=A0A6N2LDF5_SALVM